MVELRDDLRVLHLVGVGGKLHCDGLGNSRGLLAVQAFHRLLGLRSLVKADKSHPAGHSFGHKRAEDDGRLPRL